jgi:hypothetical protein
MPRFLRAALLLVPLLLAPPAWPKSVQEEIDAFRSSLADPARFPLRHGLQLDIDALRQAIDRFALAHADALDAVFQKALADLPVRQPPTAPAYTERATASPELVATAAAVGHFAYTFRPEPESVTKSSVGTVLPVLMSTSLGMPTSEISGWIGFFQAAKPSLGLCGRTEQRVSLCMDYGGQDVFVLDLERDQGVWAPAGLAWWQKPSPEASPTPP